MTETTAAQAPLADTSEQFKLAFGHQPAGVAIITATDENGEPAGFTASSLTSVAAEPPIIAFSLKANSGSAAKIAAASSFLVHMLDAENVTLAKNFATHDYPRFADTSTWEFVSTGEPLVHGVRRVLRATPLSRVEAGPALVFTARVEEFIRNDCEGTPLVYHSRNFHALGEHSNVNNYVI